ncbi:sulfatase-like hydrolase/transferase [Alienimonas californiensis]|uniref:Arylsulfatase n=1 Tax=Alienimonas californiensis TaxID=2527989 RepID=A0A517PFH1_9PLAN|nr:sulfatase-like hydrolase/transferase [Alienimonas californiensis]QDT18131.1 Arylsulfatase [Alienimonas californiensis]
MPLRFVACVLLTCAALPALPRHAAAADRPNVLFLLTDDQRADTIAALGNPHIVTPNLDALANRGFSFSECYCLGGNSGAVCFPSRNMLLSGRTYFRHEVKQGGRTSADPAKPNFAAALGAAGYETYHHGKKGNTATLLHTRFEHSKYLSNDHEVRMSGQPGEEIVDAALEFFEERDDDRPWAMYLAFSTPHDPRVAAEEYRSQYDPADLPVPPNFLPLHPYQIGSDVVRDEVLGPFPRTLPDTRAQIHDYYAAITGLDHHIGRLLADLEARGELENTLIAFSSDHGLSLGSHGRFGKQSLYRESMRAPLILAGPGVPHGSSATPVYLHDIYPTICDLLEIDPAGGSTVPAELHGRSFKWALGQGKGGRPALFGSYLDVQRSVYDGRWKLIRFPQIGVTRLFDLETDPHEILDLASDPAQAERIEELFALLKELQKEVGDDLDLDAPATIDDPTFTPPNAARLEELRRPWKGRS